jgi:hypothetical protein
VTYKAISRVLFPRRSDIRVNMMPIIFGDSASIPEHLHGYLPMISRCGLPPGKLAYLTVHESMVSAGESQRRQGVHTEGTAGNSWGGGSWGASGVYMASTDGSCRVWNSVSSAGEVDEHGGLLAPPSGDSQTMLPSTLYWMTDRTPHESLPVSSSRYRQFFRLVSDEVSVWWAQHSTANPLGVQPGCRVLTHSKFECLSSK